jgi:hypothetical protein
MIAVKVNGKNKKMKENTRCFQCIHPFKSPMISSDLTSKKRLEYLAIAELIATMQTLEAIKF